jgi:hypothetical protein
LGGGTIDTTVVDYYPTTNTCEVIDIEGNNGLGGIDIDNILTYDIIQKYSIDRTNTKWLNRIKKCAEEIKIKLTSQTTHSVYLENVPIFKSGKLVNVESLKISYSRQTFNNLTNDIIDLMIQSIKNMYLKHNTSNIEKCAGRSGGWAGHSGYFGSGTAGWPEGGRRYRGCGVTRPVSEGCSRFAERSASEVFRRFVGRCPGHGGLQVTCVSGGLGPGGQANGRWHILAERDGCRCPPGKKPWLCSGVGRWCFRRGVDAA